MFRPSFQERMAEFWAAWDEFGEPEKPETPQSQRSVTANGISSERAQGTDDGASISSVHEIAGSEAHTSQTKQMPSQPPGGSSPERDSGSDDDAGDDWWDR